MAQMGRMFCRRRELEQQVLAEIQKDQNTPEQEAILRCSGAAMRFFVGRSPVHHGDVNHLYQLFGKMIHRDEDRKRMA